MAPQLTSSARLADRRDLAALEDLYRGLEREMRELSPMWPLADGLAEPVDRALGEAVDDPDTLVVIGSYDGFPLGFLLATEEDLLPQANGASVGAIRLVFVDPEAREVGVGEAMRDAALEWFRARGITRFDAHVLPGHRLAKNFFEQGGFAARSIVMHRDDSRSR